MTTITSNGKTDTGDEALRELPREQAHRLIGRSIESLTKNFDHLQQRLGQPYSRYLTDADKKDVRAFLQRRVEAIDQLLDAQGEGPRFGWTDKDWD